MQPDFISRVRPLLDQLWVSVSLFNLLGHKNFIKCTIKGFMAIRLYHENLSRRIKIWSISRPISSSNIACMKGKIIHFVKWEWSMLALWSEIKKRKLSSELMIRNHGESGLMMVFLFIMPPTNNAMCWSWVSVPKWLTPPIRSGPSKIKMGNVFNSFKST